MRKSTIVGPVSAILVLLIVSCSNDQNRPLAPDYAIETGDIWRVEYFGFNVTKPGDWYAMDSALASEVLFAAGNMATHGNNALQGAAKESEKNTQPLFVFFQFPYGKPVESNPSVLGISESLRLTPGIESGADVLKSAKMIMTQTNIAYTFEDEIETVQIDGAPFDRMDVTISALGQSAKQSYYARVIDGYAVTFIQSWLTPEEKALTDEVISSIRFDR